MKAIKIIIVFFFFILILSCDRKSCETDNSIFLEYNYNDQHYKAELAGKIEAIGQENLRYWLHDYVKKDNAEYLLLYVQNDSLCAEILVKMEHWKRLEHVKKMKGVGSRNGEFRGLTYTIQKNTSEEIEFIYQSIERIID
jgi:hypothetical protein